MRRMGIAGLSLAIGVLATAVGCGSGGGSLPSEQSRALEANAAKWASFSASRDYQFIVRPIGFLAEPVTRAVQIKVHNGAPVSYTSVNGGSVDPSLYTNFNTVDRLFAYLRQQLAKHPAQFEVVYDPALGYPQSVFIDPAAIVADDEIRIAVTSVQPE